MHMNNQEEEIIYFDQGWEKIQIEGITPFLDRVETFDKNALETKPNPMQEFLATYDTVFQMCIQREPYNYSDRLYANYAEAFTEYFKANFIPALQDSSVQSHQALLEEFRSRWVRTQYACLGMQRMFCYLDRFFVPNSEELLTMRQYGYDLYRINIFELFKEDIRKNLLQCIHREREGRELSRELLRDCIFVYVELGVELKKTDNEIYKEHFEQHLIEETKTYYKTKSEIWKQLSSPDYLIKAEKATKDEKGRISSYLHSSTETILMETVRQEVLKNHQQHILNAATGIVKMLEERTTTESSDLKRMFLLYRDVEGGLEPMAEAMKNHIIQLGTGFIEESKDSKNSSSKLALVTNLIHLHDRFLKIVKQEFESDREFTKAMKESFEQFINKEYYVSNYLAKYVNDFLVGGKRSQNNSEEEIENKMTHIVMLYGYIRDKDVFENNYRAYLANRLLNNTYADETREKKMIGKLKQESGYHWTQKLEDMFTDIQKSKELMKSYNVAYKNEDIALDVSVCTQGAWPTSSTQALKNIPKALSATVEKFTLFYEDRHVGRRLSFRWDKGLAELTVDFTDYEKTNAIPNKKVLQVYTYQMLVLLCFESVAKALTFKEIKEKLGFGNTTEENDDLRTAVLSLAHPRTKVLLKRPNGPKLEDDHKLKINHKYKNSSKRIVVPMLKTQRQQRDEICETQQQVEVQRRHQVDAAIVRIMKARKQLNHNDLTGDVRQQLSSRFNAQPHLIKQRIEAMIELEYLERDQDDRKIYVYKQ